MTTARKDIYDPKEGGIYHCVSRCVRRAFLCGKDSYTGKSFEHRREWIRGRMAELLEIFAIDCIAYAIMNNHLHSLLRILLCQSQSWSANEVARRWRLLFPKRRRADGRAEEPNEFEILQIAENQELVELYRSRLSNLSWFNRCLNENIACRANAEDCCKGRFWEGRFKCQRIIGDAAIVACSVYIDLNPIRAGIAKTPEESDFTSIQDRIHELQSKPKRSDSPQLSPHSEVLEGRLSTQEYISLVDETGRCIVDGKQSISEDLKPILARLNMNESAWRQNSQSQGKLFYRVIGKARELTRLAMEKEKAWFKGLGSAVLIFGME